MRFKWLSLSIALGVSILGTLATVQAQTSAHISTDSPPAGAMGQLITLNLSNASLSESLRSITRQSGIDLLYEEQLLEGKPTVTIQRDRITVADAISAVLNGTGIRLVARPSGKYVLVKEEASERLQKELGSVTGRVIDSATRKGITGVTVTIEGTKLGTLTGEQGRYTIANVPVGKQVLHYRLIGYQSITRSVTVVSGKPVTTEIVMSPRTTMLSEIVTSVTGQQRKLEIGNDVTTIDVEKVLRTAPISNVTDLLETRVPGLTVIRSSGVPGAPSRLRLRGPGGGLLPNEAGAPNNDPIVIVDGIRINASQSGVTDQSLVGASTLPPPSAIDQIDVNSIDKIDVYKGPSAAALYGADAANGVIVITTKRGQVGQTRWMLLAHQGIEYFPGFYAKPGYYPFCQAGSRPGVCDLTQLGGTVIDSVVRFQALNEPRLTQFGTGRDSRLSSTVSGGSQAMTYSITGSTGRQLGLLKMPALYQDFFRRLFDSAAPNWMRRPSLLETQGINGNFTIDPRRDLRATLTTRLTNSKQRQSSAQLKLSDLASRYIDTTMIATSELGDYVTRVGANRLVSDFTLQVAWSRWRILPLTATAGFSRESRDETKFIPRGVPILNETLIVETKGAYTDGTGMVNTQTGQVNGTLLPGRMVSAVVGVQLTKGARQQYRASVDSLSAGVVSPSNLTSATQYHSQSTSGGWFAEPRLNFLSRFYLNPGFRFDGGSLSGARSGVNGGLWSLFPKLNFSWIAIDRENEAPLFGMISMLRPRVAFGVAGVQPAPGWQLRLMEPRRTGNTYGNQETVLLLSSLGNTQLRPERTREVEFGGDLDLWNQRVTLTVSRYVKDRKDAILPLPVGGSVYGGHLNLYSNVGRVRNTGTEFSFTIIPVDHPMIRWTVFGSLSKTTNTLVSLNNGEPFIDLYDGTRLVPGYPVFGRWERPILGYSEGTAGRLRLPDIIVGDSVVYMGQPSPNFAFPISMDVSLFKGVLRFNVGFEYKDGLTQFNQGSAQMVRNAYLNPEATLAEQLVALTTGYYTNYMNCGQSCTQYGLIQTVNSVRFRTFSLGYTVPRTFSQRFGVPSISFDLQGSNLGLWTNYRGKDPDVNSATIGDATVDNGQLPEPRSWRLQVRISN